MGATESGYCRVGGILGCFGSGHWLEYLEKRTNQPSRRKEHRGASLQQPEQAGRERLFRRRRAGGNSNPPVPHC